MITVKSKLENRYFNLFGADDEWKIEYDKDADKWCLYAKHAIAGEWIELQRVPGNKEKNIYKAKARAISDHDFVLRVPESDTVTIVDN